MTADQVNTAVRTLVRTVMGMPANSVRPANQAAPVGATADEFATVNLMSSEDASWAQSALSPQDDGSALETITVPEYFTASVNFYRGPAPASDAAGIPTYTAAAFERALRLPKRLQLSQFVESLRGMGLGYIGSSSARDLSGVVDAHWESRGHVDLYFSAISQETGPVDTFANADIGVDVESPGGALHERTIEVTT